MKGLSSPPETLGGRMRYAPTLPAGGNAENRANRYKRKTKNAGYAAGSLHAYPAFVVVSSLSFLEGSFLFLP